MKFNVFFKMRGPGGEIESPNTENPVESDSWETCLSILSENVPNLTHLGIALTAIRIEVQDAKE